MECWAESAFRLLIIDDNPSIHEDIRRILASMMKRDDLERDFRLLFEEDSEDVTAGPEVEFSIDSASQGEQGLELVFKAIQVGRPYSMAFVDMRMPPGWDGLETIERLWQVDPDLQIVICTAYSDQSWPEITRRLGASDKLLILKKPFDPIEILQLSQTLARKWWLGREVEARLANLDRLVEAKTRQLEESYQGLQAEVERRRLVEDELRLSQKMEAVGRLAAGIAHDFNNLLTPILGNLALVQADLSGRSAVAELLVEAEEAAVRAKRLTEQLITFARGGAPILTVCNLGKLIRDCTRLFLRGTSVRGEVDLDDDLWNLRADPSQVSRVLQNLLVNAAEAMQDQGGVVRLGARNLIREGKDYIELTVTDSGPGLSSADLPHIFEPFYTTKETGGGLGLATVYSIVHQHGGQVSVDSSSGRGACFQIWLPATREREAEPSQKSTVQTSMLGRKFLVVDDEAAIRRLIGRLLTNLGATVHEAGDGAEALEAYARSMREGEPFDAVVLDLTIPGGMGGAEILRRLRELHPSVMALVVSGYSADAMANYRQWGFQAALRKPFKADEFTLALQGVLSGIPA